MLNEIEIIRGHNPMDYFWIRPVMFVVDEKKKIHDVIVHDEISIQEENVEHFLYFFFKKYYNNKLWCNPYFEYDHRQSDEFEWFFTNNYYTYDTINKMCDEILEVANLFEVDYFSPKLTEVKKSLYFCLQCEKRCKDWNRDLCRYSIQEQVGVLVRFYRKFVNFVREIMKNNPQTTIMTIMGP